MLLVYYLTYYIIINVITQAHSPDTSHLSTINDHQHQDDGDDRHPALGMNEYISYFKSFHFEWNNVNEWTWSSSHNHSMNINESIACSKQNPSLCIHTQFTTNTGTITKQIEFFKSLTIHYKDTLTQNKIALDFWNDLDWSQVNIIHHHDTNDAIDRRHLLRGALTAKYDNIYDDDHNGDDNAFSAYALDQDDDYYADDDVGYADIDLDDIYNNLDDYYKSYDQMNAGDDEFLGKLLSSIGNRLGMYPAPPCASESRCRVHLYNHKNFGSRSNARGHFCEGAWDRWRLHKYRVNTMSISSAKVQGSPCCILIAYNGYNFNGDKTGMFPRGRYPTMRMGLDSSMGEPTGDIEGGGGTMGTLPGGMYHTTMHGFPNNAMGSMRIVHDCTLRHKMVHENSRGSMEGYGSLMHTMTEMMQMAMMMRMMNPPKSHGHAGHGGGGFGAVPHPGNYPSTVRTQQNQLQQMMHMMMASSMANRAPITISDHTKADRRRIMGQKRNKMNNMHVIGVKKCKLLYLTEICVTFDAVNSKIGVDYTVKDRREMKVSNGVTQWERMDALVGLFEDMEWNEKEDQMDRIMEHEADEEEDAFEDIEQWIEPETMPDPLDLFLDYVGVKPEVADFANRYYDDVIVPQNSKTSKDTRGMMDSFGLKLDAKELEALETKHRMQLFMGPVNYAMVRNELIFFDDFGYDLKYLDLRLPTDHDMIDYFDTFVLESQNANDWMAMTSRSDKCNDVVLSHISYWICVNEKGLIYFERHQGTNDTLYDESLQLFYERTRGMINEELDQTKLNMMNDGDWSEVYAIQQQGEERKKLCDYVSMMKLCVEGESNHFNITIHYLSDEVSKQMIRQANEILNEWVVWSDLL
eukprot:487179_1